MVCQFESSLYTAVQSQSCLPPYAPVFSTSATTFFRSVTLRNAECTVPWEKVDWPHMSNDIYATVRDCRSRAQNRTHGSTNSSCGCSLQNTIGIVPYRTVPISIKEEAGQLICNLNYKPLYQSAQGDTDYKIQGHHSIFHRFWALGRKLRYSVWLPHWQRPWIYAEDLCCSV